MWRWILTIMLCLIGSYLYWVLVYYYLKALGNFKKKTANNPEAQTKNEETQSERSGIIRDIDDVHATNHEEHSQQKTQKCNDEKPFAYKKDYFLEFLQWNASPVEKFVTCLRRRIL